MAGVQKALSMDVLREGDVELPPLCLPMSTSASDDHLGCLGKTDEEGRSFAVDPLLLCKQFGMRNDVPAKPSLLCWALLCLQKGFPISLSTCFCYFVIKISFSSSFVLYKSQKMRAKSGGVPQNEYSCLQESMVGLSGPTNCSSKIFLSPF